MEIRRYTECDEEKLFELIKSEGEEWQNYWDKDKERYKKALKSSVTFIAVKGGEVCGYVRCREDDGFGIYVYDLLVSANHRGNNIGRKLIEAFAWSIPASPAML